VHPASAALTIEVSHASIQRDLRVKARMYAAAGMPRHWVIERTETSATLAAPERGIELALAEPPAFAPR
jgi:hypothetical protein